MRVRYLRSLCVLSSIASAGACSLGALDGFSGGGAIAPDAGDAAAADVTRTPPEDATIAPDAIADSAADADANAAFCSTAPASAFFCNDFDTDPYDKGWVPQGFGFGPTTVAAASPPRSLEASLPVRGPGQPSGFLTSTLPPNTRAFTLGYDLRIDDSTTQGAVDLGSLVFQGPPFWSANLRYEHPSSGVHKLRFFEYGDPFNGSAAVVHFEALNPPPRIGGFFHVEITARIRADSSTVRIDVDGDRHDFSVAGHLYQNARPAFAVGVTSSDESGGAFRAYIDNVLVGPAP